MRKIEVGDRMVCIDDYNRYNDIFLTYGKVYVIKDAYKLYDDSVEVVDDKGLARLFHANRFVHFELVRDMIIDEILK